jgi:hypothetical protein
MSLAEWVRGILQVATVSDCFGGRRLYFDVDGCFWSKYLFVEVTLAQIYKRNIWVNFEVDLLFISRED